MPNEQDNLPDDVLDRAAEALRDMAVPAAPHGLFDRTLARLRQVDSMDEVRPMRIAVPQRRGGPMRLFRNLAMAAAVMLATAGLVWMLFSPTVLVYADVLGQIRRAQTVSFKATYTHKLPGGKQVEVFSDILITERGMRQTIQPNGPIIVINFDQKSALELDPKAKVGQMLLPSSLPDDRKPLNILQALKDTQTGTSIGQHLIAGRNLPGFATASAGTQINIWVDPRTKLPVQAEALVDLGGASPTRVAMSDFVWDAPADESLVKLSLPAGYAARSMTLKTSSLEEQDLVDALRILAELNGDEFPASFDLTGMVQIMSTMDRRVPRGAPASRWEEIERRVLEGIPTIGRALAFVSDPRRGTDWTYAGANVRLGTRGVAIMWYQPMKSPMYRVIFADLTVHDVLPQQLPTGPSMKVLSPTSMPTTRP